MKIDLAALSALVLGCCAAVTLTEEAGAPEALGKDVDEGLGADRRTIMLRTGGFGLAAATEILKDELDRREAGEARLSAIGAAVNGLPSAIRLFSF